MRSRRELARLLTGRHFGQLFATRVVGQSADGVLQAGLASYFFFSPEHQTTAPQAAAAFATLLLPYCLVGPFAGVLLDRLSRQRVLVFANVLRAALVAPVVALVLADDTGPRFYVAVLAVLSVNRFVLAGLSASLPHVVEPTRLITGNSLMTTLGGLAFAAGGGIGLVLRALLGGDRTANATVVAIAAAVYLGAAGVASRMPAALLGPDEVAARLSAHAAVREVLRSVASAAGHLRRRPAAALGLAAIGAHRFWYGLSTITTLLLYRNYFVADGVLRAGVAGFGQAIFAGTAGHLVAAAVTPGASRRFGTQRWVSALFAAAALTEVALVLPFELAPFLVAAAILGFVAQSAKICVDTIVQQAVDDDYRGRVFSLYDIVFNVAFVSAAALAALVLPPSGRSTAVVLLIAFGYAATSVGYFTATRATAAG